MWTKGFCKRELLRRVEEYLPELPKCTGICETGSSPKSLSLQELRENRFYLFNSDAVVAFSHAIEDLAMEEGSGCLFAIMQNSNEYMANREKYHNLALTLPKVELILSGKKPRENRRLKIHCNQGAKKNIRAVLYEGQSFQAMFLAEQTNEAESFEEKTFTGFFTFDRKMISQTRKDVSQSISEGRLCLLHFEHLQRTHRAAQQIRIEFARESDAIDVALGRLQSHSTKYRAKHFLADLNKTLERLNRLQTHLPELIVEQQKK